MESKKMSRGLNGEDFGQRRPPLHEMIRTILREYPSGQIFKEIIQNADDARATEVKFYLDCRVLQTLPPSLLSVVCSEANQEVLSQQFTGPALLSYNNAPFRKEDWESIQSLQQSGKAKNPHKVGKFGIGFNSVYHITDLPVILSQNYCGFLEPQESVWKGESGKGYYLENLIDECPEVLEPFDGICGFSKESTQYNNNTLFRFPLRNKASKLSSEVYDIDRLHKLLESLKEEAQYLLVFLRSVCSIEIFKITESNVTEPLFKVSVSEADFDSRLKQQRRLVSQVESIFLGELSCTVGQLVNDTSHFHIHISINGRFTSEHEWLVVNQVGSKDDEVMHLAEKQRVLPWVGAAVDLKTSCSAGRIFCVLPLPVEDRAPMCIHVNGTFAVSSNRRSLQWEAQERKGDEEGTWNKLLVKKCLPSCYLKLVFELMALDIPYDTVYNCWPDIQRLGGTPWDSLLEPFYSSLLNSNMVVHTQAIGSGMWISIQEAVFITDDVPMPVIEAMKSCGIKLVELNSSCNQALAHYYNRKRSTISPALVRTNLKHNPSSYLYVSNEAKMEILKYCFRDNNFRDLAGLQLIPLADGSFQQFKMKSNLYADGYCVCTSENPSALLPGLENKLISVYEEDHTLHSLLCSIARSGYTQLTMLNCQQVANLISQCNTSSWSYAQLAYFWQWLRNQQLAFFQNKLIVPIKLPSNNSKSIVRLTTKEGVVYIPLYTAVSQPLLTSLEKCHIKFADANVFDYLSHRELAKYLNKFECNKLLDVISSYNVANIRFSDDEAAKLQDFFSNVLFDSNRRAAIAKLPIFKVLCEESIRYSIDVITSSYADDKAIATNGAFSFRTDLLPSRPLIIDTTSDNALRLLRYMTSHVSFMTETDYLLNVAFKQIRNRNFANSNIVPFMKSVIDNFYSSEYRQASRKLIANMKDLRFVEVSLSTQLEAPCNLFDPDVLILKQLFLGECKFPASSEWSHLGILRQCGLKASVDANELFQVISTVRVTLRRYQNIVATDENRYLRLKAALKYLSDNPSLLNAYLNTRDTLLTVLRKQAEQFCWLPIASSPPSQYPSCLVWKGSQYPSCLASFSVVNPLILLSQDLTAAPGQHVPHNLIVGSEAVFIESVPRELAQQFRCSAKNILSVLQSVRDSSQLREDEAWSKVRAVLDWIADNTSTMSKADILVPVESDLSYPQLIPIDDVSYTDNEMLRGIARTSDEKYNLIHPKVSYLSPKLGLSPLSDQLDITEDVFEDAGQHEPLTTRLSNILREYKDGLTIIKEMIQNADDAGATEVNILHDTRTHSSHNLVLEGMAESHGPALIVHNNSTFTKEDFENITKLAGATKANQPLKIGKFGVGFCSVYHITDVPSFVSGEWLYIFDPTLKHLKGVVQNESRPGKKIKFRSKFLAKSQQLAPYQGLFGFDSSSSYNGTIFRLPFRTHPSQISSTIYNNHLVQMIKKDLESNGSKLLLFLQNVKRITFSSRQEGRPIVEHLSIECSNVDTENVKVCVTQSSTKSTEYWLLSNQEQRLKSQDGAYRQAVASVACKLVKKQSSFLCEAIEGNAFCFLPLSVPATGLPVHVTANFAVMSNRSGIWTGASSAMASDEREYWNQQLMTTVIPEAYCKLLKSLQAMHCLRRLLSYEFHMLWPLASNLQMKFPWESLVSSLYHLISQEDLFFSSSFCQWLEITQSYFLPSTLFKVVCSSSTDIIEAVKIMKLPIVFLPLFHSSQLQKFIRVNILTEDKFAQLFLQNIDSFSNSIKTRNEILSMMLSAIGSTITSKEHKLLKSLLHKHPCIPTSPKGFQLKRASELVDSNEFRDMFDPEDAMFPEKILYQSAAVREGIFRLGLMSPYNVCWDVIIKSAKTVESLFVKDKIKALIRVKVIIGCIEEKAEHARREQEQIDPAPLELCQTHFLPVLHKPEKYVLPWKGEGHVLLPPCQVISVDSRSLRKTGILIGSQKAIVNTKITVSGGCDSISHQALKLMNIPSQASFDEVHNQFVTLINTFNISMCDDHEAIQLIEEICQNVYEHFEASLKESPRISRKLSKHQNQDDNQHKTILAQYYNKPFIWTGKGFVCPCDVSINWKQLVGPCLYRLPGMLSQHRNLVNCLQVKESFSVEKLLGTFSQMYSRFSPTHKLPQEYHETAKNIIQDLNAKDFQELSPMKKEAILVDANYILRPTNQLVFNDAVFLPPDNDSNYVISLLIREVALALGVQPTSSKFLEKYTSTKQKFSGIEFGQREELTQRIKNILRDYPLDVTFLKELLQNADDAKASKMYVILDKREHRKERLPSENWAELQGPALLVWNDKEFTEKDLDGIQKLGLGSKRDDEESIGQFGIGFNVVYHVTDCPSFITRGDTLCVFDPHCRYVHGADKLCPGRRYNVDDSFWNSISDLRSCFLQDELQNKPQGLDKGVLFRFPLRCTKELVMKSELVNNPVRTEPLTADIMEMHLRSWVITMKDALLFLNHIVQFEYYVIENSGSLKCEKSYVVHMEGNIHEMRASLKEQFSAFKQTKKPFLVTYPLTLETKSLKSSTHEHWLIQQGVGDVQDSQNKHWEYLDKTLPKHGIAATHKRTENFLGKVFCFLPLPVYTELPVHINGQFVLNSDRRSLWASTTNKHDSKTKWNASLIKAIASSYVHFLERAKHYYVNDDGYGTRLELLDAINNYYSLFPFFDPPFIFKKKEEKSEIPYRTSQFAVVSQSPNPRHEVTKKKNWKDICSMVFQLMWQGNLQLLATELKKDNFSLTKSQPVVSWVAQWHKFQSDIPKNQAYFKSKESKEVKQVLRQLGMILTCAPPILCSHLLSQEVQPAVLSSGSVYDYYSKFHTQIIGKCPCPINQSPFKTMDNLCFFLNYLLSVNFKGHEIQYEFPCFPDGIPLLLTADSQLRVFTNPPKVLCSKYAQLFKNSSSWILHEGIITAVGKLSSTYFISNLSSEVLNEMMVSNFSLSMKSSVVENTNYCIIAKERLMELWSCLCYDPNISQHRQCIVENWAIIPSVSGKLYSASSPVLPLLRSTNSTYMSVFLELADLNVPLFDSTDFGECLARDYCVDVSNVSIVLAILFHHHAKEKVLLNLKAPQKTIQCLFQYFGRINFAHDSASLHYIQRLPLFETVNGDITSLENKQVYCWPNEACKAGYSKWASSDKVVFLPSNGKWGLLCNRNIEVLGGQHLTESELYICFIFPVFQILTSDERMKHLKHIKDTLFSDLQYESQLKKASRRAPAINFIEKLKKLPCLETSHGNLQAIKDFSDHNMAIFTTFREHFQFVPEEYQKNEWLEFLKALGLRVTITTEEFKSFAAIVSTAKHKNVSKASSVLVEYLFSDSAKEWHTDKYVLSDIAKIPFVKVASLGNLEWIKKSCQPPLYLEEQKLGLTMLNQSVIYDSASLIWTVKPVVNLPVPSYMYTYFSTSQQYYTLLEYLGITLRPDSKNVLKNLINVSQTGLAKFDLFHKYNLTYVAKDIKRVTIETVIKQCFDYLFEHKAHEQLQSLCTIPCIPVSAMKSLNTTVIHQPVLVKPIQVVRYIPDDCSHLFPYLHTVPDFLVGCQYLKTLGIADNIEIKTLRYLLDTIHQQLGDKRLDPNHKITVREAVIKMHSLLINELMSPTKAQDISPLYYPNNEGFLVDSTTLIFLDSSRYKTDKYNFSEVPVSLFQLPPQATHSVIKTFKLFSSYDPSSVPSDILCLQLPKNVRPHGLSLICREELLDHNVATESNSPLQLHFSKLKSIAPALEEFMPKTIVAHYRYHAVQVDKLVATKFSETLVEHFINTVKLVIINNLRSKVIINDTSIATIEVKYLFQKNEDEDEFILYVDKKATTSYTVFKEITHTLCVEIARMHNVKLTSYIKFTDPVCDCLRAQCIEDLIPILEKLQIDAHGINDIILPIQSNAATLGGEIPNELIDLLENDMNHIFHPEEWVGYENEYGNFIYVIVLYAVAQESFNPLERRYVIAIDSEGNRKEVSTLDLYKLMKVSGHSLEENESQELVLLEFDSASAQVRRLTDSYSLLELKKQIIQDLKFIWMLQNEDQKRKAIKRLYLKYHPDKRNLNDSEANMYDEAFKFLKQQIENLENGRPLEDPDLPPTSSSETSSQRYTHSHWSRHFDEWDEGLRRRRQRSRNASGNSYPRNNQSFGHGISQPQADPIKAGYWLKQAECDLKAMLILNQNEGVQCQVLFLCHETCEKALKAGMYELVGLNDAYLKSHELLTHAYAIAGMKGGDWAELPSLVYTIETEQYYLKTRYPNQHYPSVAPVDIYCYYTKDDEVLSVVNNAQKLIKLIQRLF
ncbi:PREDICTED: sacsin-like [Amphimedon queenslandica]|uniref:HEPN domain-containing protein n=1 Tax=Amphimedon queenslandica TaxID=400682 RepID=A0AAN0J1N7_AMPQE|nr:PREDICTED: sacsin-like [Amphimedon queenslandica]|eukprot:XP_019850657.1 PREDICTED: sacsin-like [Amphimedon queenslandica]